jgi:hypothetical protein
MKYYTRMYILESITFVIFVMIVIFPDLSQTFSIRYALSMKCVVHKERYRLSKKLADF